MHRTRKGYGLAILFGVLAVLLLTTPLAWAGSIKDLTYSQFIRDVEDGRVERVVVDPQYLTAEYATGDFFRVYLPAGDWGLHQRLMARGVHIEFRDSRTPWWTIWLTSVVPLLFVLGLMWAWSTYGTGGAGQAFSFGRSQAQLHSPSDGRVTMQDVAGVPEVKEELAEIVDFLRNPDRYQELGARIPKGVLLFGPPGTGKTLLARAVAGEAGVAFFSASGSEFVEMFAGVGASRVRDLFTRARQQAPCIIFVDEMDAVGRHRGAGIGGGSDEREQTLNQLLVEMDGFSTGEGIIVMGATNRIDVLDAAILRPGRFDRQIAVDPPDRQGRREILAVHARGKVLAPDVELDRLAAWTVGFTGADLANLLNEAALLAARQRKQAIAMPELRAAFERVVAGGPALRRMLSPDERFRIAIHEAGHAVVASQVAHGDPIEKVTIAPRGKALGYVLYRPGEEKQLHSRAEFMDRITTLLGGRAAEQVVLGEISSGAGDDLERATGLARRMATELGMSPEIGPVSIRQTPTQAPMAVQTVSERMAMAVDESVRQLVTESYRRAMDLVQTRQGAVQRLASALVERESLDGVEVERLITE